MRSIFLFLHIVLNTTRVFSRRTVEFFWNIGWNIQAPDGFTRPVLVVNGLNPGPTIVANFDDTIIVHVTNELNADPDLNEPTSIHWHGMIQSGTNGFDGVSGLTQVSIKPNETFVYTFKASIPGTFWWHSHTVVQYVDGLRGAIVVKDPFETLLSQVVFMTDWYHDVAEDLLPSYLSPESEGNEPQPSTGLINSHGQNSTECHTENSNIPLYCKFTKISISPPPVCYFHDITSFDEGSNLARLRIINGAAFSAYRFSVDNHLLLLIEEDGMPINPVAASYIDINVGQRYDVLLCRVDAAVSSSWVRMEMITSVFPFPDAIRVNKTLAVLDYVVERYPVGEVVLSRNFMDSSSVLPSSSAMPIGWVDNFHYKVVSAKVAQDDNIDPYDLTPRNSPFVPAVKRPTVEYPLDIVFAATDSGVNMAFFNNISYNGSMLATQPVSLLDKAMAIQASGGSDALGTTDPTVLNPAGLTTIFNTNEVVQLVINNYDKGEHPMHLHGHRFWVMARGYTGDGPFNPNTTSLNEINPILRDTVTVNANSYIVLRFADPNPGVWFFHCHIDWHVEVGLAMVFVEYPLSPCCSAQNSDNLAGSLDSAAEPSKPQAGQAAPASSSIFTIAISCAAALLLVGALTLARAAYGSQPQGKQLDGGYEKVVGVVCEDSTATPLIPLMTADMN